MIASRDNGYEGVPVWDIAETAAAFGLGQPVEVRGPVARGAMGVIWRLDTRTGSWAIKHLFSVPDLTGLEREASLVDGARAAGLAAPEIMRAADGATVASVSASDGRVAHVRVYEWIECARPLEFPFSPEDTSRAGEALATMHAVGPATDDPPDDWYRKRFVGGTWRSLEASTRGANSRLADILCRSLSKLDSLDALIDDTGGSWLICHRDFDPTNVLIDAADRFVVVDWENAGPLNSVPEVGYSLLSWATRPNGEPDHAAVRSFLAGYGKVLPVPSPVNVRVFSVGLAGRLNYLALMLKLGGDDAAVTTERERAQSAALEMLLNLPDVAMLERLLEEWCSCAT